MVAILKSLIIGKACSVPSEDVICFLLSLVRKNVVRYNVKTSLPLSQSCMFCVYICTAVWYSDNPL